MLRKALLVGATLVCSLGLAGCEYYFDDDSDDWYTYCDETGCYECDDYGCWPSGGGDGWTCTTNDDCAAGCACVNGFCEEYGFCSTSADCPEGFVCDDRASCVPEGSDPSCESNSDCPSGSICNDAGRCEDTETCDNNNDCAVGSTCDNRGTCVPQPCESNDDCPANSYCDDGGTNTCQPGQDPDAFTCQGTVSCSTIPPACPVGSTPRIEEGCYTGECVANANCPDGNPCASNTETQCIDASSCTPVYTGINCRDPAGNACDASASNCTCESFSFARCES